MGKNVQKERTRLRPKNVETALFKIKFKEGFILNLSYVPKDFLDLNSSKYYEKLRYSYS